jgi:hypothetical protein
LVSIAFNLSYYRASATKSADSPVRIIQTVRAEIPARAVPMQSVTQLSPARQIIHKNWANVGAKRHAHRKTYRYAAHKQRHPIIAARRLVQKNQPSIRLGHAKPLTTARL